MTETCQKEGHGQQAKAPGIEIRQTPDLGVR